VRVVDQPLPEAFRALGSNPQRGALFVDYDGTIAPIVPDPAVARPLAGAPETLQRLAVRLGLVAVVSGRPVSFLVEMLGQRSPIRLLGLYGLEELDQSGEIQVCEAARPWRLAIEEAARTAAREAPAGVRVEDKGLTVTLHWREVPQAEPWAWGFAARAARRWGLSVQQGRMSCELRPPIPADKGTVVRALASPFAAVVCFGDDMGDLPAFAVLEELASSGVLVARVAVADPESPPEVAAAADVVVDGPSGALELLERVAEAIERTPGGLG